MFTKKSLPITAALILVIALASLGVAYGLWTDTLYINGTVGTGELDVEFWGAWEDGNPPVGGVCTGSIDATGTTWTVTISNAYPGYGCDLGVYVHNAGTIPVEVQPPVLINNTSPWAPVISSYPADTVLDIGPVSDPDTLGAVWISFDVPANAGDEYELQNYTFSYTIAANQTNAP